jgi:hypothetical protein
MSSSRQDGYLPPRRIDYEPPCIDCQDVSELSPQEQKGVLGALIGTARRSNNRPGQRRRRSDLSLDDLLRGRNIADIRSGDDDDTIFDGTPFEQAEIARPDESPASRRSLRERVGRAFRGFGSSLRTDDGPRFVPVDEPDGPKRPKPPTKPKPPAKPKPPPRPTVKPVDKPKPPASEPKVSEKPKRPPRLPGRSHGEFARRASAEGKVKRLKAEDSNGEYFVHETDTGKFEVVNRLRAEALMAGGRNVYLPKVSEPPKQTSDPDVTPRSSSITRVRERAQQLVADAMDAKSASDKTLVKKLKTQVDAMAEKMRRRRQDGLSIVPEGTEINWESPDLINGSASTPFERLFDRMPFGRVLKPQWHRERPDWHPLVHGWDSVVEDLEAIHGPLRTVEEANAALKRTFPNATIPDVPDFDEVADRFNESYELRRLITWARVAQTAPPSTLEEDIFDSTIPNNVRNPDFKSLTQEERLERVLDLLDQIANDNSKGSRLKLVTEALDLIGHDQFFPEWARWDADEMRELHKAKIYGLLSAARYRPDLTDHTIEFTLGDRLGTPLDDPRREKFGLPADRSDEWSSIEGKRDYHMLPSSTATDMFAQKIASAILTFRAEYPNVFKPTLDEVNYSEFRYFSDWYDQYRDAEIAAESAAGWWRPSEGKISLHWSRPRRSGNNPIRLSREANPYKVEEFTDHDNFKSARAFDYVIAVHEMGHFFHYQTLYDALGVRVPPRRDLSHEYLMSEALAEDTERLKSLAVLRNYLALRSLMNSVAYELAEGQRKPGKDTDNAISKFIEQFRFGIAADIVDIDSSKPSSRFFYAEHLIHSVVRLLSHHDGYVTHGDLADTFRPGTGDFQEISVYGATNLTESMAEGLSLTEIWRIYQRTSEGRVAPVWLRDHITDGLGLDEAELAKMFTWGDTLVQEPVRKLSYRDQPAWLDSLVMPRLPSE